MWYHKQRNGNNKMKRIKTAGGSVKYEIYLCET